MQPVIDHLILGISDLEKGIQFFQEKTGITPRYGGFHPAYGTHNALCSIGPNTYLEIIAPREAQSVLTGPFQGYHEMEKLTPCGWAIAGDLNKIKEQLNIFDLEFGDIHHGARKTASGNLLEWQALFIMNEIQPSINPFFLQWKDRTVHPAKTSVQGVQLKKVHIATHELSKMKELLSGLHLNVEFVESDQPEGSLTSFSVESQGQEITFSI